MLLIVWILSIAQSKSRYLHVYLRHLIDHVQQILLIATFGFNWPTALQQFFDFTRPVSQPWSQLLTLDCLVSQQGQEED